MCSFGTAPGNLASTNNVTVLTDGKPALVMTDVAPMANVTPFGLCTTVTNPQVAAATAAALGVLTPQPCIPQITGAWIGTSPKVLIGGKPCVTMDSSCVCAYGGQIKIVSPGQVKSQAN